MKKLIFLLAAVAMVMSVAAQQYIIVNDHLPVLATDVDVILYEPDEEFESNLLSNRLASDPKTAIFSRALQITGLADTLKAYWKQDYDGRQLPPYYYRADAFSEVAFYTPFRYHLFTVFAETDGVYHAQGITDVEGLKAYAKQVYDEAFPEDAAVSDPTDRRNSLNRFVAYHILEHGSSYYRLTGVNEALWADSSPAHLFYDRGSLTDISAWYATLMPHAALKCSYPYGEKSALYLNHRGLQDGPDKYGCQVRGAMIVPFADEGTDPYTHNAFNGCYFYIDRILAYDQTARDQVLGGERWRVDCPTLSPDIMNVDTKKLKLFLTNGYTNVADPNLPNTVFTWDIENFAASRVTEPLVVRRSHGTFVNYEGDDMRVFDDFDITIKLPPLPAGDWEVRLGQYRMDSAPKVNVYLNGELTYENYPLALYYYQGMDVKDIDDKIFEVVRNTMLVLVNNEDGNLYIEDRNTGERIVAEIYRLNAGLCVMGRDIATGESVDWTDRAIEYLNNYLATLPKKMKAPNDVGCGRDNPIRYIAFSDLGEYKYYLRNVLGRLHSDGMTDNYLRLERSSMEDSTVRTELDLDFLEFCPVSICDNEEIPEE